MESLTTHNPHVCLTNDDLEAINTLYPVTSGAVLEPSCRTSPMYLGFVRMTVYIVGPLTLALLLSICLHTCLHTRDEAEIAHARRQREAKNEWLQTSAMASEVSRSRVDDQVAWQAAEAAAALVNAVPTAERNSRRTPAYHSNYLPHGGLGGVADAHPPSLLAGAAGASSYAPAPAHCERMQTAGGALEGVAGHNGSVSHVPLAALHQSGLQSAQRSRKRATDMEMMVI